MHHCYCSFFVYFDLIISKLVFESTTVTQANLSVNKFYQHNSAQFTMQSSSVPDMFQEDEEEGMLLLLTCWNCNRKMESVTYLDCIVMGHD